MNKKIVAGAVVLIVGIVSFYGGIKYDQSKIVSDRQNKMAQFGAGFNGTVGQKGMRGNVGVTGGGIISGDILSKDDPETEQALNGAGRSVTIKLRDGGSKIVFFSNSATVTKSATGTPEDLIVGKQIMVTGTTNSDGSVTAQSIQIR